MTREGLKEENWVGGQKKKGEDNFILNKMIIFLMFDFVHVGFYLFVSIICFCICKYMICMNVGKRSTSMFSTKFNEAETH